MNSAALRAARETHALGERNKTVVRARHCHSVFSAAFKLLAQAPARKPARCPFPALRRTLSCRCRCRRDRDPSTINGRASPSALTGGSLGFARGIVGGSRLQRNVAHEAGAVGRRKVEHQPRRLAFRSVQHESLFDAHRPLGVEHDARAALHDQPVAKRLDQAAALLAGLGRQLEVHLRQVHHDAVGIGECKGRDVDFSTEVDHKSRLLVVPADAHVAGDDRLLHCGRKRVLGTAPSAAKPAESLSSAQARMLAMAIARAVTNPNPL